MMLSPHLASWDRWQAWALRWTTEPKGFAKGDLGFKHAEMQNEFGRDDTFTALVKGDVFSSTFLKDLRRLHDALEDLHDEKTSSDVTGVFPLSLKKMIFSKR